MPVDVHESRPNGRIAALANVDGEPEATRKIADAAEMLRRLSDRRALRPSGSARITEDR